MSVLARPGADPDEQIGGSTVMTTNTAFLQTWSSDGLAFSARLNGNAETEEVITGSNDGSWFDGQPNSDNISIGGLISTAGPTNFYNGAIAEILVYDGVSLTDAQIAKVENYLLSKWGL